MKLQIALEWFLNPDHLPLIVGITEGWYGEAGLEVELVPPDDHYDGLAGVAAGEIAFACNEPLHMVDAHRPGLRALGCFFETEGGILLHASSARKLLAGEPIRLASPVAGGVTDTIAREILKGWAAKQGTHLEVEHIAIESAGFMHLENMQAGFDGAWLCFANFEGVEARAAALDHVFVTAAMGDFPNFSALELFTHAGFLHEHSDVVERLRGIISRGAQACIDDPAFAARSWYSYSGSAPDPLMDAILKDTCPRLVAPLVRDSERWRRMWSAFEARGLSAVDAAGYAALYA
ncbi:ABC transporter substrate-binding protein [Aquimonas voraii]|uniref:Thiamine pyrimidine synthase n=1 Tax=Aquimonas voraii TaxID=265719 RepID=A0A1G6Y1N2_9GAMM|nr:ABC transporter substrate-binding protein [Aquimonas voraii]SDD84308.1 ABC-type nitrate/sulfonate/bicarbonate transport system, substrate-binding protein [Aquimonas voraii]